MTRFVDTSNHATLPETRRRVSTYCVSLIAILEITLLLSVAVVLAEEKAPPKPAGPTPSPEAAEPAPEPDPCEHWTVNGYWLGMIKSDAGKVRPFVRVKESKAGSVYRVDVPGKLSGTLTFDGPGNLVMWEVVLKADATEALRADLARKLGKTMSQDHAGSGYPLKMRYWVWGDRSCDSVIRLQSSSNVNEAKPPVVKVSLTRFSAFEGQEDDATFDQTLR